VTISSHGVVQKCIVEADGMCVIYIRIPNRDGARPIRVRPEPRPPMEPNPSVYGASGGTLEPLPYTPPDIDIEGVMIHILIDFLIHMPL